MTSSICTPAPWRSCFRRCDEDYGYVTLEAFLSHKPVVTTIDAGGPNEFVTNGANGWVTDAGPEGPGGGDRRAGRRSAQERTDGR